MKNKERDKLDAKLNNKKFYKNLPCYVCKKEKCNVDYVAVNCLELIVFFTIEEANSEEK